MGGLSRSCLVEPSLESGHGLTSVARHDSSLSHQILSQVKESRMPGVLDPLTPQDQQSRSHDCHMCIT